MSALPTYTIGCTRAGRWWHQCVRRRGCDHYRSGYPARAAAVKAATLHDIQHETGHIR